MKRKVKTNENRGITLITLVVTVIALLILAGISINLLINQNGLIKQSIAAKEEEKKANTEENLKLAVLEALTEGLGKIDDIKLLENSLKNNFGVGNYNLQKKGKSWLVTIREKSYQVDKNGTIKRPTLEPGVWAQGNQDYEDENGFTIIIPSGFMVSEKSTEQTVETGVVIKDEAGNEWVWIPIDNIDEWVIQGENSLTGTTQYSNLHNFNNAGKIAFGYDDMYYEPALSQTDEYNSVVASMRKYNGFYIGRYELTGNLENPTEKAGEIYRMREAEEAIEACQKFSTDSVTSTMIWGIQWDMTMEFVSTKGDKKVVHDADGATGWGNYSVTDVYNSEGNEIIKVSGSSDFLPTGITNFTKANNIYDLAGNANEFTQEGRGTILRGNLDGLYGRRRYASCRYEYRSLPGYGSYDGGTRAIIYLNV